MRRKLYRQQANKREGTMKKQREPTEAMIIRSCCQRAGIRTDGELGKQLGLSRETVCMRRMNKPGNWLLSEIRVIAKITGMSDEDILTLVRG